jgi:hypothetical protein
MAQRPCIALSAFSILVLALASCTHSMKIKNLDAYTFVAAPAGKGLVISLQNGAIGSDEHELFSFVRESLAVHPAVERVVVLERDTEPEPSSVVARLAPATKYDGSGWNYLITFPGFLLFTHAWNGFLYEADVTTDVEVRLPNGGEVVRRSIETKYDLRFCDFDRGAATSSGWYTPGYGGINLLIGFAMMNYDEDATPEFLEAVRTAYGRFIANQIVEMAAPAARAHAARLHRTSRATYHPATGTFEIGDRGGAA